MARTHSFDIGTGVDLQEVDNAVNQARKEVAQRYDFKNTRCALDFDRQAGAVTLEADDAYRLEALRQVLAQKLAKRGVPLKNVDPGEVDDAALGRARQVVRLKQGIEAETAKRLAKEIRDLGLKKVQVQIQGDELRVSGPSRDALQQVIAFLRSRDYGVELAFGNYR